MDLAPLTLRHMSYFKKLHTRGQKAPPLNYEVRLTNAEQMKDLEMMYQSKLKPYAKGVGPILWKSEIDLFLQRKTKM